MFLLSVVLWYSRFVATVLQEGFAGSSVRLIRFKVGPSALKAPYFTERSQFDEVPLNDLHAKMLPCGQKAYTFR